MAHRNPVASPVAVKWNVALPCFELIRILARCANGRDCPEVAILVTDGGETFTGAGALTAAVAPDVAGVPERLALLAVSTTRIVDPRSVAARTYVWPVAPVIR